MKNENITKVNSVQNVVIENSKCFIYITLMENLDSNFDEGGCYNG